MCEVFIKEKVKVKEEVKGDSRCVVVAVAGGSDDHVAQC